MQPRHSRLVVDAPTTQDSFGSHDRIAEALFQLVEHEQGGQTIGLEGDWGSGKSSVIQLLSEKVTSTSGRAVFIFDAWTHQGDPLRRAFLESLIELLQRKQWLREGSESDAETAARWALERDKLARRVKVSDKKTTPTFSNLAKLIVGLLFFFPLGNALISAALKQSSTPDWALLVGGSVLCLSPLLVILFAVAKARLNNTAADDIWALFVQKTSMTEQTTTIETPDPTTIEFQALFRKLLDVALDKHTDRRLVIVLDNLDRMPPEETDSVWTMLRSFIDSPTFKEALWFQQLWVVIPFAPQGLHVQDSVQPRGDRSFLEKVIQVKFHVPTPVLSDWKEFLVSKLTSAFPNRRDSDEFFKIYRLIAAITKEKTPRPRDLISLVNEIVATNLQWAESIPISHQALFVLCKRQGVDVIARLIDRTLPNETDRLILEGDIEGSLASLAFNVDKDKALQVLLHTKLENALRDPSGNTLVGEFTEATGFQEMLDSNLRGELVSRANDDPIQFCVAIRAIGNGGILEHAEPGRQKDMRRAVFDAISKLSYWPLHDERCADSIKAFLKIDAAMEGKTILKNSLETTSAWFGTNADRVAGISKGDKQLTSFLERVLAAIRTDEVTNYLQSVPPVLIGGEENNWCVACDYLLFEAEQDAINYFQPAKGEDAIDGLLAGVISGGGFARKHYSALRNRLASKKAFNGVLYAPLIKARLQTPSQLPAQEIHYLYRISLEASTTLPEFSDLLRDLSTTGWSHHNLHSAFAASDHECIALVLYTMLQTDPLATFNTNVGNGAAGNNSATAFFNAPKENEKVVHELAELLDEFSDQVLPFKMYDSNGATKPLAIALLRDISGRDSFLQSLLGDEVVQRLSVARESYAKDERYNYSKQVVAKLMQRRDLVTFVREQAFSLEHCWFYCYMAKNRAADDPAFLSWIQHELKQVDAQTFLSSFQENSWLVTLIVDVNSNGQKLQLGRSYSDAILSYAKTLVKGDAKFHSFYAANAHSILAAIPDEQLAGVFDEIYEIAAAQASATGINQDFFALYGLPLADLRVLKKAENKILRRLVFPLVRSANVAGLAWYVDVIEKDGSSLVGEAVTLLAEFREILGSVPSDSDAQPYASRLIKVVSKLIPENEHHGSEADLVDEKDEVKT